MAAGGFGGSRAAMREWMRAPDARHAGGVTLVELLITVTLLGIISSTVGLALSTIISQSADQRASSTLDAEIRRIDDTLRAMPYLRCSRNAADDIAAYQTRVPTGLPADIQSATITDIKYWRGTDAMAAAPTWDATCPMLNGSADDKGLQLITITVKTTNGWERSRSIVKRYFQ